MKKTAMLLFGAVVVFSFSVVLVTAEDDTEYIGVSGCKTCHKSSKRGDQYTKWSEGPHAKTWTELGNDESKKIAEEAGVEGDPQQAEKCLKCHVTAYGVADERKGSKYDIEEGVTCEACHGAGSGYKTSHIKKKDEAKEAGFVAKPDADSCKKCHNEESPTYKEFDYDTKVKEIAHPLPKDDE
jgi:hypothetical protein